VLAVLPDVNLARLPRMADFGRILGAVDLLLETQGVKEYDQLAERLALEVIEGDHVADAVRHFLDGRNEWTGTATALLSAITPDRAPKGWPSTPRALAGALRRVAPALRSVGVAIEFSRSTDQHHARIIELMRGEQSPNGSSERSEPSEADPTVARTSDGTDGTDAETRPSSQRTEPEARERTVRQYLNYWRASCACGWERQYASRAAGWDGVKRHKRECGMG